MSIIIHFGIIINTYSQKKKPGVLRLIILLYNISLFYMIINNLSPDISACIMYLLLKVS